MHLLLSFLMFFGSEDLTKSHQEKVSRSLNVQEAEAVMLVYESKLRIEKIDLKQAGLQRDHLKNLTRKKLLLLKHNAVSENDFLETQLKYNIAELEIEQEEAEVEEAERNVTLAKIRLKQEVLKENND